MAQQIVGTTPISIPLSEASPVFQNLGPGIVYIDVDTTTVTATTGFKLTVGAVFEFPSSAGNNTSLWIVSDTANTDVRILGIGA